MLQYVSFRAHCLGSVQGPNILAVEAKGWKKTFGPNDLVRDDHWTELALDDWDGWDVVARLST